MRLLKWVCGAVFMLSACAHAQSEAAPDLEVSLLTFGPGAIYWERFGHNAIVVRDRASGEAISYNYGMFDFDEADFFVNFARGLMTYQIAASRVDEDIAWYASEGRFVVEQKLRFDAPQALALKQYLEWNLQPANIRYRYDYFTANCSTRVRDALNEALGGALHAQLASPSRGHTFRTLTDSLTSPQPMLMGVLDVGLGPFADRRLSFWEDSFIPMQLMAHLRDVTVPGADGRPQPLVIDERVIAPARLAAPPSAPPDLRWPFLLGGLALAALLAFLHARRAQAWARRAFAGFAVVLALTFGVAGAIMLALWGVTDHRAGWRNENLLVLSPLCLLLIPTWWRAARVDWSPSRFARGVSMLVAMLAAFALFSKILPWFAQANLPWILLALPVHLVLARSTGLHRTTA